MVQNETLDLSVPIRHLDPPSHKKNKHLNSLQFMEKEYLILYLVVGIVLRRPSRQAKRKTFAEFSQR